MTFRQLYPPLEPGELLRGTRDLRFREAWELASVSSFRPLQVTDIAMRTRLRDFRERNPSPHQREFNRR